MATTLETSLEEVTRGLATAISMASEGRYAELPEQTTAIEDAAAALGAFKPDLQRGGDHDDARAQCEHLRRQALTFAAVMRHAALIHADLLRLSSGAPAHYTRAGMLPAASPAGSARPRLLNEEA